MAEKLLSLLSECQEAACSVGRQHDEGLVGGFITVESRRLLACGVIPLFGLSYPSDNFVPFSPRPNRLTPSKTSFPPQKEVKV